MIKSIYIGFFLMATQAYNITDQDQFERFKTYYINCTSVLATEIDIFLNYRGIIDIFPTGNATFDLTNTSAPYMECSDFEDLVVGVSSHPLSYFANLDDDIIYSADGPMFFDNVQDHLGLTHKARAISRHTNFR